MVCLRSIFCSLIFLVAALAVSSASPSYGAIAPQVSFLNLVTQEIRTPVRIAIDQPGNIFVADPRGGGVLKYDHTGAFIKRFQLKGVRGIAVMPGGDIVVSRGNLVVVLDSESGMEKFKLGQGTGQFKLATGIAVDDTGRIFIADSIDNCVQVFSPTGVPVALPAAAAGKPSNSFGTFGSQSGQFSLPTGISFEKISRQLVITDSLNGRLQFFTPSGIFRKTIGSKGVGPLSFSSPQSVAFEYTKDASPSLFRMYVVDAFQSEVQVIDPSGVGSYLSTIGGYGVDPGRLVVPSDVLFDQDSSRLIVANGQGNLSMFGINVSSVPTPDLTPPEFTLNPVPAVSSSSSIILSGTIESEAFVSITSDSGAVAGPVAYAPLNTASAESFWSTTVSGLTNGLNTISLIAKDRAANPTVRVVSITYIPSGVRVAINRVGSPTNARTQVITGTMDSGATVTLSSSTSALFSSVTYPTATSWQSTVSGLVDGNNVITATAAKAGASSATSVIIAVVTTPPDMNVSMLADGSVTSYPVLNVSGYLPVDGYFDALLINGQPVQVNNDYFTAAILLNFGRNEITIRASDKAGNSSTLTSVITFNPDKPVVTIASPPDGTIVNDTSVALNGTAGNGTTVRLLIYNGSSPVAGTPFTAINQPGTGTVWSTAQNVPLDPGINTVVAEIADQYGTTSSVKTTIIRDANLPSFAVTVPLRDSVVSKKEQTVTGTVSRGATLTASLVPPSGAPLDVPVVRKADGTFEVQTALSAEGTYNLSITAVDSLGNAVTANRAFVYDVTAPTLSIVSANPLKVTFSEGSLVVRDKNGPVSFTAPVRNADGSIALDLTNALFDAATLDVQAVDMAGNSTRNGDIDSSGNVDIRDALKVMRMSVGLETSTVADRLRGDVAPLVHGKPAPDGVIDVFDVIYLLEKIVGLH